MSKRASYREGVAWIAHNDEPLDFDVVNVAGYISTTLLADLFAKDPIVVARSIVKEREIAKRMCQVAYGVDWIDHYA